MKIAIPLANGRLSLHFGHCESFCLIDVDPATKEMTGRRDVLAPPHQPGLLPRWLAEQGSDLIIAGGMGQRAQGLFQENGIEVVVGAPPREPQALVNEYLSGSLKTGGNICDH
jgi:predicted Fe-Mo cluster-binding NifX family protein